MDLSVSRKSRVTGSVEVQKGTSEFGFDPFDPGPSIVPHEVPGVLQQIHQKGSGLYSSYDGLCILDRCRTRFKDCENIFDVSHCETNSCMNPSCIKKDSTPATSGDIHSRGLRRLRNLSSGAENHKGRNIRVDRGSTLPNFVRELPWGGCCRNLRWGRSVLCNVWA